MLKTCLFYLPKITGCVSISVFSSLVCVPLEITSSAVGKKICAIADELNSVSEL